MNENERNAELLRAGLEAANRDDYETVVELFDPDVESHVASGLGNPGTWRGIDGFLEMTGAWNDAFVDQLSDLRSLAFPGPAQVIAEIHQTARGAVSGAPVEMTIFYLLEVRDGRAVRFHIYGSREDALAAAGV